MHEGTGSGAKFGECSHDHTITVITAGLEHVVCESCGDVTVRYESAISGDVQRSQFAREADSLHNQLIRAQRHEGVKSRS